MIKQYIEIKAETNSGYISNKVVISDKDLRLIEPVFRAIRNFKSYITEEGFEISHNFPLYSNILNGEKTINQLYIETKLCKECQILKFKSFCPEGEIHTITDVDIIYVSE